MISSMTGYGHGQASKKKTTAVAEVRTVNNRYLEVSSRLPRTLALRENDVKELIRTKLSRGKVSVSITIAPVSVARRGSDIPRRLASQRSAAPSVCRGRPRSAFASSTTCASWSSSSTWTAS